MVDYFVLVECRVTHQNRPKPLHYQDNLERFSRFRSKVIHIALDSLEGHSSYYRSGCWPQMRCTCLCNMHRTLNVGAESASCAGSGTIGSTCSRCGNSYTKRLQRARGTMYRAVSALCMRQDIQHSEIGPCSHAVY